MRKIVEGVWRTSALLSSDECAALVSQAEAHRFQPAHLQAHGRHNEETYLRLQDVVEKLTARLQGQAAAASDADFQIVAMAGLLEFYRYREGSYITPHRDDPLEISAGTYSDRTLVVYLNDDFGGGETVFDGAGVRVSGATGEGVLFDHSLSHAGAIVRRGIKYILRASVATAPKP